MKARPIVPVIIGVIVTVMAGFSVATAAPVPAVRAGAGIAEPSQPVGAMTYTIRLPLILNCYPQPGPDPYFIYQSDMSIIHADKAWGLCNLNAGKVTIAIIDTGVDLDHPDLQANLVAGYDYVDNDVVPEDGNGHGTNVAGIAAAALNGIGVAGVAPTAKILPVRVLDSSGSGNLSNVAAGITYAADRAQILNLSLGTISDTQVLQDAVNYAVNTRGRLVIAAAGNCGDSSYPANGCSYQNQPVYPAAYSNVMAVAATTSSDTRASFSNIGSYVDIAAPGVSIYNTFIGDLYTSESGTSQATPHVAGLAALVWAKNPGYTAAQVWSVLASTAVDLGAAGVDPSFGAGRIDVQPALALTSLPAAGPTMKRLEAVQLPVRDQRDAPIAPGRIIVRFKSGVNQDSITRLLAERPDTTVDKSLPAIGAVVLSVPVGAEWTTIDALRAQSDVAYAEPDYVLHLIR